MKEYEGIKRIVGFVGIFVFCKFFYHLLRFGMPDCFLGEIDLGLCVFVTLFFCFSLYQLGVMSTKNRHNQIVHYLLVILIIIILAYGPTMPAKGNPLDEFYVQRYNVIFFTTTMMIFSTFMNLIVPNKKTA